MKKSVALSSMILALCMSSLARAGTEGHGGDPVEVLFSEAQKRAAQVVSKIQANQIADLQIEQRFKDWLSKDGHLGLLQLYVNEMNIEFDKPDACIENGIQKPTCYDDSVANNPKMYVVPSLNRETTEKQAAALVIHEAGHFAGESKHKFLSALGAELIVKVGRPKLPPSGEELENGGVSGNMFADEVFINADGSVTFIEPRVDYDGVKRKIYAKHSKSYKARIQKADFYWKESSATGICKAFGFSESAGMGTDTQSGTRNFVQVNSDGAVVSEVSYAGLYACEWRLYSSDAYVLDAICKVHKYYVNSITCK